MIIFTVKKHTIWEQGKDEFFNSSTINLAKNIVIFSYKILQKNPNELFGQLNTSSSSKLSQSKRGLHNFVFLFLDSKVF